MSLERKVLETLRDSVNLEVAKDGKYISIEDISFYRIREEEQFRYDEMDEEWECDDYEEIDFFYVTSYEGEEFMIEENDLKTLLNLDKDDHIYISESFSYSDGVIDYDYNDSKDEIIEKWNNFKLTFSKATSIKQFKVIKD